MKLTAEYLSQLGVSNRLLSDISEELGSDFQLLPEDISVLSEGDFPLERLLKSIVQSDDFSSEHPFFRCCIEFAPRSILSYLGNDISPAILEELILREPVFALQRVIIQSVLYLDMKCIISLSWGGILRDHWFSFFNQFIHIKWIKY